MNEETLIKTMELSDGRDWRWFADLNIVGLGAHLDEAGRERALSELQACWRRGFLRVVPDGTVRNTVSNGIVVV